MVISCGQHSAYMLTPELPGAGSVLVFDNGGRSGYPPDYRNYSKVVEFNPVSNETVWYYEASISGLPAFTFFRQFIGNAAKSGAKWPPNPVK